MTEREDAHKRAIEDYSQFSQHLRTTAQFVVAANGGAALAMLSCLTALVTKQADVEYVSVQNITSHFAYAAGFYLLGVFTLIAALFSLALSKMNWGHFWENAALCHEIDFKHFYSRRGERLQTIGFAGLGVAALLFVPGSVAAITAFI